MKGFVCEATFISRSDFASTPSTTKRFGDEIISSKPSTAARFSGLEATDDAEGLAILVLLRFNTSLR